MAAPAETCSESFSQIFSTVAPPAHAAKPLTCPCSSSSTTTIPDLNGSPSTMKKFQLASVLVNAGTLDRGEPVAVSARSCIAVVAWGLGAAGEYHTMAHEDVRATGRRSVAGLQV